MLRGMSEMVAGRERQVNGVRLFFYKVDSPAYYLKKSSVPFFPGYIGIFAIFAWILICSDPDILRDCYGLYKVSGKAWLELGACFCVKNIGKADAGKLQVRFDEGGLTNDQAG